MQEKLQYLDHQIVTSCIAMVNVVFLLFIWKEMTWKIPNLENLEFYTCTLWDHNAKFLIMAYRRNSWVPNDCILVGINETEWTTFVFHEKWCATKLFRYNFWNVWLIILTTWNFKMPAKLQFLDHQIVTSCIAMGNVVFLLFIWKEMTWKIPNLENLEFYTCTLWDHNAKFLIMVYRRNSWVPNDCILVVINETEWTTFDFMRNDVLQNNLGQFLKCLADNFDNLKFQDASKVAIFRPPNSYILHCHSKSGLFTLYLKGNGMKNSKFGKSWILYMYTLGPQCKIFIYGLQEELMGAKWLHSGRNKWNWVNHLGFHEKWCATK